MKRAQKNRRAVVHYEDPGGCQRQLNCNGEKAALRAAARLQGKGCKMIQIVIFTRPTSRPIFN